jgi:hypothetical protein
LVHADTRARSKVHFWGLSHDVKSGRRNAGTP